MARDPVYLPRLDRTCQPCHRAMCWNLGACWEEIQHQRRSFAQQGNTLNKANQTSIAIAAIVSAISAADKCAQDHEDECQCCEPAISAADDSIAGLGLDVDTFWAQLDATTPRTPNLRGHIDIALQGCPR